MALEELQEAEERLTFLDVQRQDLFSSIEDTTQAIKEIDQDLAPAVHGSVQGHRHLLRPSHSACCLEAASAKCGWPMKMTPTAGSISSAQPPGKRLQNVLLLSGGEKALVALALLIAIFRYTPSPFCVLDEVDAPLDESNVDRFTRMIQHMSNHTQFILITHSKRTMEIAEVLYGVTMEEPGVSRLVSVKFDAIEQERIAVPA